MDHQTTRETLELAAAEPGGLDRLMAGDTASAQMVAGHLAGCPECTAELARLERAARVIRDVVTALPPTSLRERTLETVRAAGVQRGVSAAPRLSAAPDSTEAAAPIDAMATIGTGPADTASRAATGIGSAGNATRTTTGLGAGPAGRLLGWAAAIAAAVVISVVATTLIVGARVDERFADQAATIEALENVAVATLEVTAEPDARRVALSASSPGLTGTLVFSPSTSELVVVATGLTPPPPGQEYRCWVQETDDRERVGKMFFGDGLAYWIGPVPAVEGLVGEATFGVSLVSIDGSDDREDVLLGDL